MRILGLLPPDYLNKNKKKEKKKNLLKFKNFISLEYNNNRPKKYIEIIKIEIESGLVLFGFEELVVLSFGEQFVDFGLVSNLDLD